MSITYCEGEGCSNVALFNVNVELAPGSGQWADLDLCDDCLYDFDIEKENALRLEDR